MVFHEESSYVGHFTTLVRCVSLWGRNRVLTFAVKRVWHSIGSDTSQQHFSTLSEVDLFIEKHLAFQVNSLTIFDELTI